MHPFWPMDHQWCPNHLSFLQMIWRGRHISSHFMVWSKKFPPQKLSVFSYGKLYFLSKFLIWKMEHRFLEMCHLVQINMGRFRINKMTCCVKQGNHLAYEKQTKLQIASEFCKNEEPEEMHIADVHVTDLQFACLTFCCAGQLCEFLLTVIWVTFG